MKNLLLIFTLIVIGSFHNNAFSQESRYGIKGGVNLATIGGDSEGVSSKVGIHLGAYASFKTSDLLTIQPEIVYSAQGAQDDADGEFKAKYNYINIPVIFKIFPSEGFNIQAGPQLGILTSGKFSGGGVDVDITSELNTLDFAIALGLGYDLENVNFALRYNLGVSNTAKDTGGETYPNRVFQISMGYTF